MQANPQAMSLLNIVPLFLIFIVFYLMVIKPQQKRDAEHKKLIEGLKKNDEVILAGGIHGVIVSVKDTTFGVRVDDTTGTKIEVEKNAIATVTKKNSSEAAK